MTWRKTSQALLPVKRAAVPDHYDIAPAFALDDGLIQHGFDALARALSDVACVMLDGYGGVMWDDFRHQLDGALHALGCNPVWIDMRSYLRPETEIEALIKPFLGGDDPLFGTRFTGTLADFYANLPARPALGAPLTVLYGCGAALANWNAPLVYVDVPKNEIQFRSRAGSVTNLGASAAFSPKVMYKRFYFVDWVALNAHKAELLPRLDWIVDAQRPEDPLLLSGAAFRTGLHDMTRSYCRPRPWFEPGPWGGQWIKQHIPELPQDVPNYAWSFEAIVPENGVIFESDGYLLEVSFDWLMVCDARAMLGRSVERFGVEFPIRFDFLDTFDGGNLSVQVHPHPDYIRQHFGETYTQDETYYILDCAPDAQVYLGFRADIDPEAFRAALETSISAAIPIAIEQYVNIEAAHKHDLFLIPAGTIHCSGVNNLVLEISATPYIFTFKMYDWMRLDLDGKPRPLNIERAFANLDFSRSGDRIRREFCAHPQVIASGAGWQVVHVPTHADHFYDVHRLEFDHAVTVTTDDSCHVLSLVEGSAITLETANGRRQRFAYAETFIVPAAAGSYRLINEGSAPVKVVKAFIKPEAVS